MGTTNTKSDIANRVFERAGVSKAEATIAVELVIETIKATLERGEKIKVSSFGNFEVRDKRTRSGRNPQNGQEMTISARRVVRFKASDVLKQAINGK